MQTHNTRNNPWTKGEKFLLAAILLPVALAALGVFWWRQVNTTPVVTIPTPAMPAQNAFDYFNAASVAEVQKNSVDYAIQISPHPPHPAPGSVDHPYSLQQKAALVQANALTLKTFRQGLTLPYQNPPIRSFDTLMPYYAKFRSLARLLRLESQVRESQGDWARAVNSNLDAIQMGEKIPRGGLLIGMLVGVACESIGRRTLWAEVDHLSAAQARAAVQRLEEARQSHVPLADTLQEEEWFTQASLLEIFRRPDWRGELRSAVSGGLAVSDGSALTAAQMAQLNFSSKKTILGDYTTSMNEFIGAARQPYGTPLPASPTDLVSPALMDNFPQFRLNYINNEAQDALLLTTLALRAYKLEHGAYPVTLKPLTPAYLNPVPVDPFAASSPLHYKRQGAKYVLYSVGPDSKDDGGKPIFDSSTPPPKAGERDQRYSLMQDSQGDIVAGVNP